ncbi:MAG: hypothetical protein M1820_009859 [Bogoriella megaspora]|nr:MAG: hypothetical protein M1820_009859 [Bogoriella megaspora]
MAEIIGTISAANNLIETAFQIIKRLRQAYERQKESAALLDSLSEEILSIGKIVSIVEDEDALQTANVSAVLIKLRMTEDNLVNWLKKADPGKKGLMRQSLYQLVHGSKEYKILGEIKDELTRVKSDLSITIQVAHVGVTWTAKLEIVANNKIIRRVNKRLVKLFGKDGGLKIADLLEHRSPRDDGLFQLSEADLASLNSGDDLSSAGSEIEVSNAEMPPDTNNRIIIGNSTKAQALMINGPIGEDMWRDISYLRIENNTAEGNSTMVNHATSFEVLKFLTERQDANKERERQWQSSTNKRALNELAVG